MGESYLAKHHPDMKYEAGSVDALNQKYMMISTKGAIVIALDESDSMLSNHKGLARHF